MKWFLNPWALGALAALIVFLYVERLAYGGRQYAAGERAGMAQMAKAQEQANKEVRSIKGRAKNETQNLDRDGLVREWCNSGRVRNPEHCPK